MEILKSIGKFIFGLILIYLIILLVSFKSHANALTDIDPGLLTIAVSTNKSDPKKLNVTLTADGDEIVYTIDEPKDEAELKKVAKSLIADYRKKRAKH